jgi:hypothetical protein
MLFLFTIQDLAHSVPIDVFPAYDQTPAPIADDYLTDPDYPVDAYF